MNILNAKNLIEDTIDMQNLNNILVSLAKEDSIDSINTLKILLVGNIIRPNRKFKEEMINNNNRELAKTLSYSSFPAGLDCLKTLLNNYPVDTSVLDPSFNLFYRLNDETSKYYMRTDLLNKKLDLIEFMLKNGLYNRSQLQELSDMYIHSSQFISDAEYKRINDIKNLVNKYLQLINKVNSWSRNMKKNDRDRRINEINKIIGISMNNKAISYPIEKIDRDSETELDYRNEFTYIKDELPKIIKKSKNTNF